MRRHGQLSKEMFYRAIKESGSKVNRQAQAIIDENVNFDLPKNCPYCGGKMLIKPIGELNPNVSNYDKLICVCEHYLITCSCSVPVIKKPNGTLKAKGTPADENLKYLREEVHFYMQQVEQFGIMTKDEIYIWLSHQLGLANKRCHFSILQDYMCQEAIKSLVKILKNHPNISRKRVRRFCPINKYIPYSQREVEVNRMLNTMVSPGYIR